MTESRSAMTNYQHIPCPTCHGSKYEPSVLTKVRDWCRTCDGQGWFMGYPQRLMTLSEFVARAPVQP